MRRPTVASLAAEPAPDGMYSRAMNEGSSSDTASTVGTRGPCGTRNQSSPCASKPNMPAGPDAFVLTTMRSPEAVDAMWTRLMLPPLIDEPSVTCSPSATDTASSSAVIPVVRPAVPDTRRRTCR